MENRSGVERSVIKGRSSPEQSLHCVARQVHKESIWNKAQASPAGLMRTQNKPSSLHFAVGMIIFVLSLTLATTGAICFISVRNASDH